MVKYKQPFKSLLFVAFLASVLLLGQTNSSFAQELPPPNVPMEEFLAEDDFGPDLEPIAPKNTEFHAGLPSVVDTGKTNAYLPLFETAPSGGVAATEASGFWYNLYFDELCSFPSGWSLNDFGASGEQWQPGTSDGLCVARLSDYVDNMNIAMTYGPFSLAGATNGQLGVVFKNDTEWGWDFFVTQYSCDGKRSWKATPHYRSGYVDNWTVSTTSLWGCRGRSQVYVRLGFLSDSSVSSYTGPEIDTIWIDAFYP